MRSVEGKILNGDKVGYTIRVEDDADSTGGFLVLFEDPNDPSCGGDYWVETFDDIQRGIDQLGWQVQWNQPLETLR